MNRKKVGFIVLSVALLAAVALTGITALQAGGSTGPASVSDSAGMRGNIEYTVRDSAGNVKYTRSIHNTDGLQGHTVAAARLFNDATVLAANGNDAFRAVFLTSDQTGEASVGTGIATVTTNPANDGTVDCSDSGTDRVCVVSVTFTANAAAAIAQLKLVKGADDTTTVWGSELAISDIMAWQNVAITLAATDQLTVTWTVTIS